MRRLLIVLILLVIPLSSCDQIPVEIIITYPTATFEAVIPTETAAEVPGDDPTETPTETAVPQITATLPSTGTPVPTNTPSTVTPTKTATPIQYSIQIQPDSPVYIKSFVNQERGCDWLGVAGQVLDKNGKSLPYVVLVLEGQVNGKTLDLVGLTGSITDYGPGGYEMTIGDRVFESRGLLRLSVYDLDGKQLSADLMLDTYNDCEKNLIIVNYVEK